MSEDKEPERETVEGEDTPGIWGDYPIDSVLVRQQPRSIFEVLRRIEQGVFIMNPEFQRDFVWDPLKQSRLIESVLMRIPLPVFYLAENPEGKLIVVDGLQRLTTFKRFVDGEFALEQLGTDELNGKQFADLMPKLKNRIEDTQLILYIIDAKVPERARLDIFDRVNSGVPLNRQQMRNCLYVGNATRWLREEASTRLFKEVTGGVLDPKAMKDREFVNRFCAFELLGVEQYDGELDAFLARGLTEMNLMTNEQLRALSDRFRRGLQNNINVFGRHSFRKNTPGKTARSPINVSLFDVFACQMARLDEDAVSAKKQQIQEGFFRLMRDNDFVASISQATSSKSRVATRFTKVANMLDEVMHADAG